jgi:hypothetical protein
MGLAKWYKNYTIVASALEESADKWLPEVTIRWTKDGREHAYLISPLTTIADFPLTSYPSREEADNFGIQQAKAWINALLK